MSFLVRIGSAHRPIAGGMFRRTSRIAYAVAGLCLVSTACAHHDSDSLSRAPEIDSVPVVTQDSALPLEGYILSTSEQAELKEHYREALRRCAARYGGEPIVVQPGTEELLAASRMWGGRFGTMTQDHASANGYHAGPDDPVIADFGLFANDGEEPLATILYGADRKIIGEEEEGGRPAIEGLPRDGCIGEVTNEFGGDPLSTVPQKVDKIRLTAFRDERTQDAVRKWSSCMEESGFRYKSVDGPIDEFGDGRELSEEEISTALADVECTRKSRWRDISFAIEKAYQEAELVENREYWESVSDNAESILEKAREMASGRFS